MDFAISKETITTNETVYKGSVQQFVDCDITLPEYCPDILRILKCQLIPRTNSHSLSGNRLSIDGSAILRILYIDEKEAQVHSYEQVCPFNKPVDVNNASDNSIIELECEPDYVNCRAINQRRLDINAALILKINISTIKDVQILSSASGNGIQTKTENVEALTVKGFAQKTITVDETLELSRSDYAVAQLIRYDGFVLLNDVKVITNKLLVKGELTIKMLYTADDKSGKIESLSHTLPISQIIDVDGLDDTDKCRVNLKLSSLDLSLRSDSNGELRQADIIAKISVIAVSAQNVGFQVIKEAYSVKCALDAEKSDMTFVSLAENINDTSLLRNSLDVASIGINSVTDMWINTITSNSSINGNKLKIFGNISLSLLVTDSSNQAVYLERQVEFENYYDINGDYNDNKCDITINVNAIDYILHGNDKIDIRMELKTDCVLYRLCQKNIIVKIEPNSLENTLTSPCALTIYFCDKNESVWDIAKKYNTTVDAIMSENELDCETIEQPRMLMIPSV